MAERLCWQVARRDDSRIARRLYRQQVVAGGYPLAEGAGLDDCFYCLQQLGVVALLDEVQGTAAQRERVPFVQDCPALSPEDLVGHRAHARAARCTRSR